MWNHNALTLSTFLGRDHRQTDKEEREKVWNHRVRERVRNQRGREREREGEREKEIKPL